MTTYIQLLKHSRRRKIFKSSTPKFEGNPFKVAYVRRVFIMKPKKPNSAKRMICRVKFLIDRKKVRFRYLLAYIPGFGHHLSTNDEVLLRGGRVPDLPGVRYHVVRGKKRHELIEDPIRRQRRSKFGVKKEKTEIVYTRRGNNRQLRVDALKIIKSPFFRTNHEPELFFTEVNNEIVESTFDDVQLLDKRLKQAKQFYTDNLCRNCTDK